MAVRLLDLLLAAAGLVVTFPILVVAAIGITLSSPGPILYRAQRVGQNGKLFTMYKLRSMSIDHRMHQSSITAHDDPRTFWFGYWLRYLKIDELPQLFNILRGDMSIVGPRAEDPQIVRNHYLPKHHETLLLPPGLASPGSIFNYTHGEKMLDLGNAEQIYVAQLLPIKLALDRVYVQRASIWYNIRVIFRTLWVIGLKILGKTDFADPPEMESARALMSADDAVGRPQKVSLQTTHNFRSTAQ